MENAINAVAGLFAKNNPLAWVLGAVILILLGIMVGKLFPKLTNKQAFTLLVGALLIIAGLFIFDKLMDKGAVFRQPDTLTLLLHEPGNRDLRPISGRGRLEIRDAQGQRIGADIGFRGEARFGNVPAWVFEQKEGVIVDLLASVADSNYALQEKRWHVEPHDTIYMELSKRGVNRPAPSGNELRLSFVTSRGTVPFRMDKRKSLNELLDRLKIMAQGDLVPGHGEVIVLWAKGDSVPSNRMHRTLSQYGLKNGDEVGLGVKSFVKYRVFSPAVTLVFDGMQFGEPKLKLNGHTVELSRIGPARALAVMDRPGSGDSIQVQITNNNRFYAFKVGVGGHDTIRVNMADKWPVNINTLFGESHRALIRQ